MKTSNKNLFSNSGIDRIEEYMRMNNILYLRKDDQNIEVPSYGYHGQTVQMVIHYDSAHDYFRIGVKNGIEVDVSDIDEVQHYINHANYMRAVGTFYVCIGCEAIEYRFACWMTADQLSDEFLKRALDDAFCAHVNYALPSQLIINGGTVQDALDALPSAGVGDESADGGGNENL